MIKIEIAKREGAKIVLGLAGTSGSGKTYSALQVGYGLANCNGKKLGFLDTENRRGRLYADTLPQPFLIGDLAPPFSPARYIEAIQAFEKAGVEVLIIDSATHEWEGTGGCEEIATDGNPKFPRWNKAKAEHKKFMNVLLQSSMHIIVCFRAREKVKVLPGGVVEPLGLQPITEKNAMFEMTASCMMQDEGRTQTVLKCPEAIRKHVGRGTDYLTVADGKALRAWIDGATPIDRDLERHRATLANTCEQGTAALSTAWTALPKPVKLALKGELEAFKASAAGYDEQRRIATAANGSEEADDINNAIADDAVTPTPTPKPQPAPAPEVPPPAANQIADDDGDIFG